MARQGTEVAHYLLERLKQLGVSTMFGVPGDFNLGFLDVVENERDIDWVGNCNELNAAYAADGYARVKHDSVGVLLTTFGVGELSALNGIAGSYAEMIPIVHIVGVPQRAVQQAKPIIHHTLGDGRFDVYTKAAALFTAAQAFLDNEETAAWEIDRVLVDCITLRRPVYIAIPTDMVMECVSAQALATPLRPRPMNVDHTMEASVVERIHGLVEDALIESTGEETVSEGKGSGVIILVDICSIRKDARKETLAFVKATGLPVYCSPMGKSIVDESYERYGGVYIGAFSRPAIKDAVESAALILSIGSLATDFNTGMFTSKLIPERVVQLHSTQTQIGKEVFPAVGMKSLLPKLSARLESLRATSIRVNVAPYTAIIPTVTGKEIEPSEAITITQTWIWPRISKFLRRGDVVITETGTANFGIVDVPFPDDCTFISQLLFGSIGYTVGGTLGAAVAARELGDGRTILFIGDGSLQLGVQELSTMIMKGVHPIIFLLNNSGYTIERFLLKPRQTYHDIMNWEWTSLLRVLGDIGGQTSKSYTVSTKAEMSALLDDSVFADASAIQLVEVMLDKLDAPDILARMADMPGRKGKDKANV